MDTELIELSYFPGCSLATSAEENNESLKAFCRRIGYLLTDLEDWNCCGSSSIYGLDPDAAFSLSARNLSLARPGRPLFIACPKCLQRMRQTQAKLRRDEAAREKYEKLHGKPFDDKLRIISFFELIEESQFLRAGLANMHRLQGLKFVPYYGCLLNNPPEIRPAKSYYGFIEKTLSSLGAEPVSWACPTRCCGTFLAAVKPQLIFDTVNEITAEAKRSGADVIVTPCAMCQMNLEMRCSIENPLPVLHFTEVLELAMGSGEGKKWFKRHLIDPSPLLGHFSAHE
jgi:heterodisulfide reductase subunit B2